MPSGDENSTVGPEPQAPAPAQLPAVIAPANAAHVVVGPKLAATLVLTGAVVVAIAMPMLTLKIPSNQNSLAARPTPAPVRIVSAPQRAAIPCTQQTWPYIEAHCLKQGGDKMMPVPIGSAPETTAATNGEPARANADAAKAQAAAKSAADSAEKRQTAAIAPGPAVEFNRDANEPELNASAPILGRVPLPQPRPVAADDSDEEFAQPEPRREARPRRYYYEEPRHRLVRELNRVIPFGILRF